MSKYKERQNIIRNGKYSIESTGNPSEVYMIVDTMMMYVISTHKTKNAAGRELTNLVNMMRKK